MTAPPSPPRPCSHGAAPTLAKTRLQFLKGRPLSLEAPPLRTQGHSENSLETRLLCTPPSCIDPPRLLSCLALLIKPHPRHLPPSGAGSGTSTASERGGGYSLHPDKSGYLPYQVRHLRRCDQPGDNDPISNISGRGKKREESWREGGKGTAAAPSHSSNTLLAFFRFI